ncbi:hypothetical protein M514_10096 [Trichuris suis]|uniref:Ubiquitin-like modifier-activating enzyme ATG7 n=1 Tax=Trichuris suis TaxID=68888 RepID=A0A085MU43_9BILA|nr:hypothetical protein M514_10096 [Trichuris suis]
MVSTFQSNLVAVAGFRSYIDNSFWYTATKRKVEEWKLDDTALPLFGYYTNTDAPGLPPRLTIDFESLEADRNLPPNHYAAVGKLLLFNSLEAFRAFDLSGHLKKAALDIWADMKDGTWLKKPCLLYRFQLFAHIDPKKYVYHFIVGHPVVQYPAPLTTVRPIQRIGEFFDEQAVKVVCQLCQEQSANSINHFILEQTDDASRPFAVLSFGDPRAKHLDISKLIVVYCDPSTDLWTPGWPLRNLMAAWATFRPDATSVRILCWRLRHFNGGLNYSHSLVLHLSCTAPSTPDDLLVRFLPGLERNAEGSISVQRLNLSTSLDPSRLSENATKLNLNLMRWRVMPELDLETIFGTSCLLFGSGTLGCNISRCLGSWGIRKITLVDNGRVSYSNPARQSLFTVQDCIDGGKWKHEAAAAALKQIFPAMEVHSYGYTVPMPGHIIEECDEAKTVKDVEKLENLVKEHDVIFLLMDTREGRWLPTLLSTYHSKLAFTVAVGFDSYLILRHGVGWNQQHQSISGQCRQSSVTKISGNELACYFCCDVTAPGNSVLHRTLDQQCTVTRPGVSMLAAAVAVELMASCLQHPLKGMASAEISGSDAHATCLGAVPHQVRGYLSRYEQVSLAVERFSSCVACSVPVLKEYRKRGGAFVIDVCNAPVQLESITANMSREDEKFIAPTPVHLLNKLPLGEERLPKEDECIEMNPGFIYSTMFAAFSLEQQRVRLPIYKVFEFGRSIIVLFPQYRNAILYLLEKYQTLVLLGETGCGKSTQVPQYLLEAGWTHQGKICVSEPRRVAAVTLASRVAEERGTMFGQEVGYVVRFDDFTKRESTKIKYVTDGILVREIMRNPLLTEYSVIMVDEAHERNVNTDILLGLLRKVLAKRTELRLLVSSATLDAVEFRRFFNFNATDDPALDTATIMSVEGRSFPIDIYYTKGSVPNYVNASVKAAIRIHRCEPSGGDILIFLTGEDEVNTCCNLLKEESKTLGDCDKLWIVPIYGAMPFKEQIKVFDSCPVGTRKVVVATNIAEASVTVPGIVYVIDCGFVKLRAVHPQTGIESLVVVPISKASAEQRAGRAGRVRYGKAYRLYPGNWTNSIWNGLFSLRNTALFLESEFEKLRLFTVPEIQRTNLAPALLQLKSLGVDNVLKFHYISQPPSFSMIRGLELLRALGAIDDNGELTRPLGYQIAELPLPPMHAKALLMSGKLECSEEMLSIIAMMQIQNVFLTPVGQKHRAEIMKRQFSTEEGDHLTMLNVFTCFNERGRDIRWCKDHYVNYRGLCRAAEIRQQLLNFLKRFKVPLLSCRGRLDSEDRIRQSLVYGFFSNAAKLHHDGTYHTIREDFTLKIYKGSAIMYRKEYPKWVIFTEVLQDCMRDISVIDSEWLYELVPEYYEYGTARERALKRKKEDSDEE